MTPHRVLLLLACVPLFGQPYTISTIAGEGAAGIVLNNPTGVAVDSAGNLFVADWSGMIRKIWAQNGGVTTVAGIGIIGYGGDGGQATAATIGKGIGLALDAAGNLYFADGDNNRIRRVDAATGIITTVAGSGSKTDSGDGRLALDAGVSRPTGITLDAAGNLYFSSSWSRVRRVDARTGIIETIAGQLLTAFGGDGGPAVQATFWDPIPSAIGRNGDLFITDFENSRIRVISAQTGMVMTFAGSGPCPNSGPFNTTVCQGGFGGDGGPAQNARLNYAGAAAMDSEGNLLIADTSNHRIRMVDAATHLIFTIAGTGANGYSGDGGPALSASLGFPAGIAVDGAGRVYFSDENNQRIRVLTPSGPRLNRFVPPILRRREAPERNR